LIFEVSPTVVMPGDELELAGAHFSNDARLEGLGDSVVFQRMDEGAAVAKAPSGSGVVSVNVQTAAGRSNTIELSYGDGLVVSNDGLGFDGEVASIAVTSGEVPMVYAATMGGVYRSRDNGITWQRRSVGLEKTRAWSIVAAPQAPDCLYVCTVDGRAFKTHNHGQTWQPLGQPLPGEPYCRLAAHPTNPDQVFANVNGWIFRWNGTEWSNYSGDLRVVSPSVVDRYLYGVPYPLDGAPSGIWRFDLDTGRPELVGPEVKFRWVSASPVTPGLVFASTTPLSPQLFISRDSGSTWSFTATDVELETVLADPTLPDRVYGGTPGGIYRSDDLGRTFSTGFSYLGFGNTSGLALVPGRPDQVWIPHERGPLRAQGTSWVRNVDGMAAVTVRAVVAAPSRPTRVYLAGAPGLYRSDDGGRHWTAAAPACNPPSSTCTWLGPFNPPVFEVFVAPADPDLIWISAGTGWFRSADAGDTWEPVTLPQGTDKIAMDGDRVLAHAYPGYQVSNDGGLSFSALASPAGPLAGAIRFIDGTAFVASNTGLFSWSPEGSTWTQWIANPDSLGVDVIRGPAGGVLYATDAHLFECAASTCRVAATMDGPFQIAAVGVAAGSVFIGNDTGLYRMDRDGQGLTPLEPWNRGIGTAKVQSIAVVDPASDEGLLIGTSGHGVFRSIRARVP
jgi:photosystem II stability/assembly factor-like uncharacterized protein